MADGLIQVPADSTGKKVDTSELTVGANTVERQRSVIAGAAATELADVHNTAPSATDFGLIVRNIIRKNSAILSTSPLSGNGVFTGSWNDTNGEGTVFVEAAVRADQASAASGFVLQESDDSSDGNFTRTITSASVSASTTTFIYGPIRSRYWRVVYTNGSTLQGSFKITASAGDVSAFTVDASGNLRVDLSQTSANATALKVDGSAVTQPVSGTFWQATQPISAASLPLPTGAATAAKQPALGTAGSAAADVITIQGIASMTAVKVDGSAVTQPVSISGSLPVKLATTTSAITAGTAGNTVVKNSAGTLMGVLVTTSGTNALTIFDNASTNTGTIIGVVPAGAPVGLYTFNAPAANGITVAGNGSNPAVTVMFA